MNIQKGMLFMALFSVTQAMGATDMLAGLSVALKNENSLCKNKPEMEAKKVVGSVLFGSMTGGALIASLALCQKAEALHKTPLSFFLMGLPILYSNQEMTREILGESYVGISNWTALVTAIAAGLVLASRD
ncbi:MAG: hypothetical protein NTX86_05890 [Candidatus Dependentiae bacterium]|nr:hypothetical protein [Candidatus Dependentiae bacterium]